MIDGPLVRSRLHEADGMVCCLQVKSGTTAAVFGLGAVGLAVVEALVCAGCTMIIGVDTNPSKFEAAKEWGCTHCINPKVLTTSWCPHAISACVSVSTRHIWPIWSPAVP